MNCQPHTHTHARQLVNKDMETRVHMYVYECFCAVYIFNVSKVSRQNVILGNGHMTGAERTRTTTSIETKNLSTRGEEVSEMVVEQQQQKKN